MQNPYSSPTSEITEIGSTYRLSHVVIAMGVSFILLATILSGIFFYYVGYMPTITNYVRPLALLTVSSMLSGAVLAHFRKLQWYWMLFAGPVIAFGAMMGVFFLLDSLRIL